MAVNIVDCIDDRVMIHHILVSVSEKGRLEELVPSLIATIPDLTIYSTGGTFGAIQKILGNRWQRNLKQVSQYTGQPEMQGGLVKTLDFKVYLGLLSETYNPAHAEDLRRTGSVPIDMVIVNLYPFRETISAPSATVEHARANIDIGGPCMVRAAAKNFLRVASVTDPADYADLAAEIRDRGGWVSLATRFELAKKAFAHTAEYDAAIAAYLAQHNHDEIAACYSVEDEE